MNLLDTTIITERLKLVPLSETYAPEIFRELTEDVTMYMFTKPPKKIEETIEFIQKARERIMNGEELNVSIFNKNTGEFLGGGGAKKINTRTPELGIWIKKSAHGNKYGREAVIALKDWIDQHVDHEYIKYPVDKKNIASRKIAEALGGVMREEYPKENMAGNTLDIVEYWIYRKS